MKRALIAALILGIILGATGSALAGVAVSKWRHSSSAHTCSNNVAAGTDLGAICVSTKRDRAGGRLQVMIDRGSVAIVYNHPKRGGEIYWCRTGLAPVGYHPGGALPPGTVVAEPPVDRLAGRSVESPTHRVRSVRG